MGNDVSYACKNVADPNAKAERAICLTWIAWIKDDVVTGLWIVWTVFWGLI